MNKHLLPSQIWPERPYVGLDYFREKDAPLLLGRTEDVRACTDLLLGFGVKLLILQGSTGAGKSSFLHAGLIPHLKHNVGRPVHFIDTSDENVIRCTADPLPWIGRALAATRYAELCAAYCGASDTEVEDEPDGASMLDEALFEGPRRVLADAVLDALERACNALPGKLVLVLDQAEEVLTHQHGSCGRSDAAEAFFYFLEEAYVRNIDVRIVISLRTEYYGRFREELGIPDDRLSGRPKSGGVAPYLLRPIRDRDTLIRIAMLPAVGQNIYRYKFDQAAAEHIVDDLLKKFRHGSVTPMLQVICAMLYEALDGPNRTIVREQYLALGSIDGISLRYVDRGLRDALGPVPRSELDSWYRLLCSLVSRQGGGTVVSEIEPVEELRRRAGQLRIADEVAPVPARLCGGRAPLLRGHPSDAPVLFSLKHDVLAVVFANWKVAQAAHIEEQEKAAARLREVRATQRRRLAVAALVLPAIMLGTWYTWDQYTRLKMRIERRLELARDPPRGDFSHSLLALAGNVHEAAGSHGPGALLLSAFEKPAREQFIEALREALNRTPWFTGEYLAAAVNPQGNKALLLHNNGYLEELDLALDSGRRFASGAAQALSVTLPDAARRALDANLPAIVGYLDPVGPAALIDGRLYFWKDGQAATPLRVAAALPASMRSGARLRYEFVAGALQVSAVTAGARDDVHVLRLRGQDVLSNRIAGRPQELIARINHGGPRPLFAESPPALGRFAHVSIESVADAAGGKPNGGPGGALRLVIGQVGEGSDALDISRLRKRAGMPSELTVSMAFVANDRAVLIASRDDGFYLAAPVARPGAGSAWTSPPDKLTLEVPASAASPAAAAAPLALAPAYRRMSYSPLAATKLDDTLRFAWLTDGGVWVAQTGRAPGAPAAATPLPGHLFPLLTGEPGGSKLRFSNTGDFLILQQQPQYSRPLRIRIWNLSPRRRALIQQATPEALQKMACEVVERHPQSAREAKVSLRLFEFPGEAPDPCNLEKLK